MDLVTEELNLSEILADSPGNPLIWNKFLTKLTQVLSCDSSVLLVTDLAERANTHFLYSAYIPSGYQDKYENHLNKLDTFNYFVSKTPKQVFNNLAFSNSHSTQVKNDFIPLNNQCIRFGLSIPCSQNHSLNLIVNRKNTISEVEQKQISNTLQSLIPALENAMYAEQGYKISSQLTYYANDYFDGYIVVDRKLNILFSDPLNRAIISQMGHVKITENRLGMKNPIIEQQLLSLMEKNEKVDTSIYNQNHTCKITLIPLSLLQNLYKWECYKNGIILTFTHDKEKNPTIDRLMDIYHLSRCEAVCALHFMKTPSIPDIANNTYRSQETVRNHIKHSMQKMDVHNQAGLMKKLLTLATL